MATSVTFICLKYPYQKNYKAFDVICSKGGVRKNRHMTNQSRAVMFGDSVAAER